MEKILKSTDLLKTRDVDDNVNFDKFKEYFKTEPPGIYRIFMETYDVGRGKRKDVGLYIDSQDMVYPLVIMEYKGNAEDYIGLYDLLSINESIEAMKNAFDEDDEIHDMELAPFAECFGNMLLMVGIGVENKDKLYIENTSLFKNDKRFIFVAENVFEFIRRVYYGRIKLTRYGIEDYSELYKNWGEKFWRVRDDN